MKSSENYATSVDVGLSKHIEQWNLEFKMSFNYEVELNFDWTTKLHFIAK